MARPKLIHDLTNYWCPRCRKGPVEKSKHKNLCRPCYNADYNKRTKKWYAENRAKGYGKRGRPTGPPPVPKDEPCMISAAWLSRPLVAPSHAAPRG